MAKLYKYFRPDQNFYSTIINQQLWFSNPKFFNDPFDCNLSCDFDFEDFESFKIFFSLIPDMRSKSDSELSQIFEYFKDKANWPTGAESYLDFEHNVTCFSRNIKSLLMWSHYADSHKGIAISFDRKTLEEYFKVQFLTVRYPAKFPSVKSFTNSNQFVDAMLSIKYKDWKYEKEVRMLASKNGLIPFPVNAIKEVIFGAKCSKADVVKTANIFLKPPYDVRRIKFKIADLDKAKFGLFFTEIDITS